MLDLQFPLPNYPLKERPKENRCACGHRFPFLVVISAGLHLESTGSTYALVCPDCGAHCIIATSHETPDALVQKTAQRRAEAEAAGMFDTQKDPDDG